MTLKTFELHWVDSNCTQIKHMISHEDYLSVIKPIKELIYILEVDKSIDSSIKILELKTELKRFKEPWFTDKSPIAKAIETGFLENQYGRYKLISKIT